MSSFFARLSVDLLDDDRAHAAGPAMSLYVAAVLAVRRAEGSGFISRERLSRLAWGGAAIASKHVRKLVDVGLFQVCDGGWFIVDYAAMNDTGDVIEARRLAEAKKKAAQRSGKSASVPGDMGGTPPIVPPLSLPHRIEENRIEGERGARAKVTGPEHPAGDLTLAAWADGVVASVAMATGRKLEDTRAVWAQFVAHLSAEGRPVTRAEWTRWVTREVNKASGPRGTGPAIHVADDAATDAARAAQVVRNREYKRAIALARAETDAAEGPSVEAVASA